MATADAKSGSARGSAFLARDGRVSQAELRLAALSAAFLIAVAVGVTPFAQTLLGPSAGLVGVHSGAMFTLSLMLALLLLAKGTIEQRGDSVRLAYAYFYLAAVTVTRSAAVPDAYIDGYLIGQRGSALWLWLFRHAGFGVLIAYYAWRAHRPPVRPPSPRLALGLIAVVIVALSVLATRGINLLPRSTQGPSFWTSRQALASISVLVINAAALVMVLRLHWRTSKQLWVSVAMVAACVEVWLTMYGVHRYSLGWYVAKAANVLITLVVLASYLLELTVLYGRVARVNATLATMAAKDALTGLDNRRRFDEALELEWKRARREKHALSLLMIDVDQFKPYNDTYGHVQGDECLRRVAQQLATTLRRGTDLVARYGGEEFAVLLPATDAEGASRVAQSLLESVRAGAIPHDSNPPRYIATVSIGVATVVPDGELDSTVLVERADAALYTAKVNGRDRAEVALARRSANETDDATGTAEADRSPAG